MPLPPLSQYCVHVAAASPGSVTFPGGVTLSAQAGVRFGDAAQISEGLFAAINSALMPLQPFFNIIGTFQAAGEVLTSIPKSLVPPNPQPIVQALVKFAKALDKLLALVPALSVPVLAKGILTAVLVGLAGTVAELQAMAAQQARIDAAQALAGQPGNEALQEAIDCALENHAVQVANLGASMGPLNQIIGIVNLLLGLAGLPEVPTVGSIGSDAAGAVAVLQDFIEVLQVIVDLLPG